MPFFHHFPSESLVNYKCCNSRTPIAVANQQRPNNNGMIKQVKSGYLLHYKKRRLFGKAWREEFVVLYEDSSVVWFRDRDRLDPEGCVFLRDAPEMLAAGQWTSRVPNKPELPLGCDLKQSIAIGSRHRQKVQWFLCKSDSELIDWMTAINKTLPPPPPPPEELRDSRRNLAKLFQSHAPPTLPPAAATHPNLEPSLDFGSSSTNHLHQHQSRYDRPDQQQQQHQARQHKEMTDRLDRMAIGGGASGSVGFSNRIRSYSAGRHSVHRRPGVEDNQATPPKSSSAAVGAPPTRQMSFPEKSSFSDVATGVMIGGVLTQWHPGGDCWDWGMGWGWTGWNAAFCGTCALEQAALAHHVPGFGGSHHPPSSLVGPTGAGAPTGTGLGAAASADDVSAQFYFDDDHELGELGEATDVGCDFGDFGGF